MSCSSKFEFCSISASQQNTVKNPRVFFLLYTNFFEIFLGNKRSSVAWQAEFKLDTLLCFSLVYLCTLNRIYIYSNGKTNIDMIYAPLKSCIHFDICCICMSGCVDRRSSCRANSLYFWIFLFCCVICILFLQLTFLTCRISISEKG